MIKRLIYSIALVIFLQSCITPQTAIKDYSTEKVVIPYQASEIQIVDGRIDKQPMNWDLPAIATKKIEVTGNPELTNEDKNLLTSLIKQSAHPSGVPSRITLKLTEGTCKLYGDWSSANEYTKVAIEIKVEEIDGQNTLISNSEVFYDYGTLNALEKSVLKAYHLALKNATHQSLSQLSKQTVYKDWLRAYEVY